MTLCNESARHLRKKRAGAYRGRPAFPWKAMARLPRPLAPGLTYHVTTRGNERRDISRDDDDRRLLLRLLDDEVRDRKWVVGSYCLMPNHLHLLVRTPEPDLSEGLHDALGTYARRFNDRHDRSGHLFQDRFHSVVVTDDAHHLVLYRYIARNPVKAGLCRAAEDWPWSAHGPLRGTAISPVLLDTTLGPFAGDRRAYDRFVRAGSGSLLVDLLADGSGRRLRAAREAGFSQDEIATALGVSQRTVSRRLRG